MADNGESPLFMDTDGRESSDFLNLFMQTIQLYCMASYCCTLHLCVDPPLQQ